MEMEEFMDQAMTTMHSQRAFIVDCDLSRRIRVMREYRNSQKLKDKTPEQLFYVNLMIARLLERQGVFETVDGLVDTWKRDYL